jgi:hypothetical protein
MRAARFGPTSKQFEMNLRVGVDETVGVNGHFAA